MQKGMKSVTLQLISCSPHHTSKEGLNKKSASLSLMSAPIFGKQRAPAAG